MVVYRCGGAGKGGEEKNKGWQKGMIWKCMNGKMEGTKKKWKKKKKRVDVFAKEIGGINTARFFFHFFFFHFFFFQIILVVSSTVRGRKKRCLVFGV